MDCFGHPRLFFPHPYRVFVPPEHMRHARPVFAYPRCTCECYCDGSSMVAHRAPTLDGYRPHRTDMREFDDSNSKEIEDVFSSDKAGRRNRTTYKRWQIEELERAFAMNPYPTSMFKKALAVRLGLRDSRVQVWFQNRRAKSKRTRAGSSHLSDSYDEHHTEDSEYDTTEPEYSPTITQSEFSPIEPDYSPNAPDGRSGKLENESELAKHDVDEIGNSDDHIDVGKSSL